MVHACMIALDMTRNCGLHEGAANNSHSDRSSYINQNRWGLLAGKGGVLNLRMSGFFSCTRSLFSTSSVISASIRAIPTGAGGSGGMGRAGGVTGLEPAFPLPLLAALVIPGILETVDAVVTGVDCCPCSVMLVPPVLGLLTCRERGWPVWGATVAPRRGRFGGRRVALERALALVGPIGSGSGFVRLGRAVVMSEGGPVPGFCMTDGRGDRLGGREGWVLSGRVVGAEGEK